MTPGSEAFLLVTSPPGDLRVRALVEALRAFGGQVFLAETPESAQAASRAHACIVSLTVAGWNSPTNVAAINALPARVIPILMEPMAPPPGPWSTPPIGLHPTPTLTAQAIVTAINSSTPSHPLVTAQPPQGVLAVAAPQPSMAPEVAVPQPSVDPPSVGEDGLNIVDGALPLSDRQAIVAAPFIGTLAGIPAIDTEADPDRAPQAAVRDGGDDNGRDEGDEDAPRAGSDDWAAANSWLRLPIALRAKRLVPFLGLGLALVIVLVLVKVLPAQLAQQARQGNKNTATYAANVPGPGCDHQGALWQASATGTVSCQSAGVLLQQQQHFEQAQEVFYRGFSDAFPTDYAVQVAATITNGDPFTSVGFEVRRQLPTGGYLVLMGANGAWVITRTATATRPAARLALGFLAQGSQSLKLRVEVHGPTMTFLAGTTTLATVADASMATTNAIGLVLSNPGATSPIAATFANFQYTPLGAGGAPTSTVSTLPNPYAAAVPGPGCDTSGGIWEPTSLYLAPTTTLKCTAQGLTVLQSATAAALGEARFYGNGQEFPQNYQVSAQIALDGLNGGCAGFLTRTDAALGGYSFSICQNGGWAIEKINDAGTHTTLNSGRVVPHTPVKLVADLNNNSLTLQLDGASLGTAKDASFTTTNVLSLFAQTPQGVMGTATLSAFTFTPHP